MGIHQKLHARLVQKLILTPSLQQAIKLLPMTTLELAELLNQEMVENPLLEELPTEEATPEAAATAEAEKKPEKDESWDDADYEYFFGEYLDEGYRPRQPQEVKELPPIENTLSEKELARRSPDVAAESADQRCLRLREIGSTIVGNIDDDGYLVASVDEIANLGSWDIADVERALDHVQHFDPIGVAARDLQECLLLQLRHMGLAGTPAETLVRDHLRSLQNSRIPELAKQLGVEPEEIKGAHRIHPAPGSEAGIALQPVGIAVRDSRRLHHQDGRRVQGGPERGWPAAATDQPGLSPAARQGRRGFRRDSRLRERQVPVGALAAEVRRPASEDHHQGGDQHHQLPARVSRSGHRAPAAARAPRCRERHRHARVDRLARRQQQVHAHPAGRV
jgi:hypothetical protein